MDFGDKITKYPLSKVNIGKDLEVVISNNQRYSKECLAASNKSNRMLRRHIEEHQLQNTRNNPDALRHTSKAKS